MSDDCSIRAPGDDGAAAKPLRVQVERLGFFGNQGTGICVRAHHPVTGFGSYDISVLDSESLIAFLRLGGGHNPKAENIVGIMLGYGPGLVSEDDHSDRSPGGES